MKSKIIIPIAMLGIVAVVALTSVNLVNAKQAGGDTLAAKVAARFGLDEAEVKDALMEFRFEHSKERHEEMEENIKERLEEAVEAGKLTSDQMFAVLAKHEEFEGRLDDLYDLSLEDRREAVADIHEEMDIWAEENNIDMSKIHRFERQLHEEGGRYMHIGM